MERILHDILVRLEDEAPVLGLSYVDEDFGQLEAIDEEGKDTYPLTYPAVLCEVQGVSWNNTDRLQQEGSATIAVRLLIDCYDDTHAGSATIDRILERSQFDSEYLMPYTEVPVNTRMPNVTEKIGTNGVHPYGGYGAIGDIVYRNLVASLQE